ncbi:mediator of RNA polymerase II transcription subunit 18-like [Anneissia japonica]|uniref:mediator of RNA polymerase II transcription subunit 18-like n=1 Tax=Anneissia japonica TaxID=1529436 RepID=UPI001425B265|nr:mediator of RNA polymerase II transcription subunit 18-like [Anneissia japonica]
MNAGLQGAFGSTIGNVGNQEYYLQGSVLDSARETLVHRLKALCDNVQLHPETFNDHEIVYALRSNNAQNVISLRARHALDQPADSAWQLRYLGQPEMGDKNRGAAMRSYLDTCTGPNLPDFLTEIGFKMDYELVCKGYMFRKGKMKVTVTKLYKIVNPGSFDKLEPVSNSHLVELGVVVASASDAIADDIKCFAEQLKPIVTMEKVDPRKIQAY